MKKIAIVDGIRTPFVKAWTLFDKIPAHELGARCLSELLQKTNVDPDLIDEVIVGCVGQPVEAANVARVISLLGGVPKSKKAYTVNRNCASGFEAVTSAMEKIQAGQNEVVIAGGAESMSNAPMIFSKRAQTLFMKMARAKSLGKKLALLTQFRPKHFTPIASIPLALTESKQVR